ncbi:hypothetical protein JCM10213_005807 [Rhodosporidiobolus nylandii]
MDHRDLFATQDAFDVDDWLAAGSHSLDPQTTFDPAALDGQAFGTAMGGIFGAGPAPGYGGGENGRRASGVDVHGEGEGDASFSSSASGGGNDLSAFLSSSASTARSSLSPSSYHPYHHPSPASSSALSAGAVTPFPYAHSTVESLAANLPTSFDTGALQSLFADPPPPPPPHSGAYSQPGMQTVSPAMTALNTSPYEGALGTFPPGLSAGEVFSSSASSSTSSPPTNIPRLSIDSAFSPSFAPPSVSAPPPPSTFAAFQQQQAQQAGRRSLAATAGITLPPSLLLQPTQGPPRNIGNHTPAVSYTLRSDPAQPLPVHLLGGGGGAQVARTPLPPLPPAAPAGQKGTYAGGMSAVEIIANAGLKGGQVYQAPLLQLRPNALPPPAPAPAPAAAPARSSARGKKPDAPQQEQAKEDDTAAAKGKKGKKGATAAAKEKEGKGGHNAVEQKYRNSINNALATLRDVIPALRHLKPLPSMPVTKRKASQFTLATAAIPQTPSGLVDGVTAAKTLSKGTILNKAIEYISYLQFARDGQNEDIELLKRMVKECVAGGEGLVEEFERRRSGGEERRTQERDRRIAEEEAEEEAAEGEDAEEEDDDEPAGGVAAAKGKKAASTAAAGKKRGRADTSTAAAKKQRLPTQHISPPLTADYSHIQALNAAHLEALASQQHPHAAHYPPHGVYQPPSPASSGEGVSPSALVGGGVNGQSPPRVLLASFMGLSFAGGVGYDLSAAGGAASVAEEGLASAWAARVVRRSAAAAAPESTSILHPSLVAGLLALGAATVVVAVIWLLAPLFSRQSQPPQPSRKERKRAQALAALSALNATATAVALGGQTLGAASAAALQARKELLRLVGAPGLLRFLPALAMEAVAFAVQELSGLSWTRDGKSETEIRERAAAWVRIAEIEASLGNRIPLLFRMYTFLHLANLSRSSSWPTTAPPPSATRHAVSALLAVHLLALGHPQWATALWNRMQRAAKKVEPAVGQSFIELAVLSSFADVQALLDPALREEKADDTPSRPSDTVPLLVLAEAACEDALKDVWQTLFVAVAASTTGSTDAAVLAGQADLDDLAETIESVLGATVEGSEVHALAQASKVFLTCFLAGTTSSAAASSAAASEAHTLLSRLALSHSQNPSTSPFSRLACATPFLQLFLPVFAPSLAVTVASSRTPSAGEPSSEADLLATTTMEWLFVRKAGAAALVDRDDTGAAEDVQVDAGLHARALSVRRLLGHELFRPTSSPDSGDEREADLHAARRMEDAKDALVDALTRVARRAAGLKGGLWDEEDSGVELEA